VSDDPVTNPTPGHRESPPESLTESHECDSIGGTSASGATPLPDALKALAQRIEAHLSQPPEGRPAAGDPQLDADALELLHRFLAAEVAITDLAVAVQHLLDRIDSVEDHLATSALDTVQRMRAAQQEHAA